MTQRHSTASTMHASRSRSLQRTTTIGAAIAALAVAVLAPAGASSDTTTASISGSVGENVSTTDPSNDGRRMRYVGNPAPDGYGHNYQWGSPYLLTTSPEDGPVTMTGTLDVSGMDTAGQRGNLSLFDADALADGESGHKEDVGMTVAYTRSGQYEVGLTDGDAGGGEWVQRFTTFSPSDLTDGILNVQLVIDGTADPATCASSLADVGTADGCMTLTVNGRTVTDSYGSVAPHGIVVELAGGGHPGWYSAWPSGSGSEIGVIYDLEVSPVVPSPRTADACKKGGYETYGYDNQGQCVSSVNHNTKGDN